MTTDTMKRLVLITSGLFFIVIVLAVVRVMMSNMLSTNGAELSKLQAEVVTYKRENALLGERVLAAQSLTAIAKKAEEQGYIVSSQTSLSNQLPLALKQ